MSARNLLMTDDRAPDEPHLVVLTRFGSPWPAEILCARLKAEGIFAMLPDQQMANSNSMMVNAFGGVRVMVQSDQLREAQAVMAALERGEFALTDADFDGIPEPPETCPKCHSTHVVQDHSRKQRALFSVLLLGIPLPFSRKDKRCGSCGHRWR